MTDKKKIVVKPVSPTEETKHAQDRFRSFRAELGQLGRHTGVTVDVRGLLPDSYPSFVMGQVRRYEFSELETTDNFAVTVTGSTSDFLFFNVMRVDGSAVTGMEYSLDIIVAV